MIRIDLGKEDVKAPSSLGGKLGDLSKIKLDLSSLSSLVSNLKGALVFLVFGPAAVLPHLFFSQYHTAVVKAQRQKIEISKAAVDALTAETQKLTPYQKDLESFEGQKKMVQDRLEAIRKLLVARSAPVTILDSVGQALPQRAWLANVDFDGKKENSLINVQGQAASNEDVSDFVDKLSESIHLQEVSLENVTSALEQGAIEWRSFRLTIIPKGSQVVINKDLDGARAIAGAPAGAPLPPNNTGAPPSGGTH